MPQLPAVNRAVAVLCLVSFVTATSMQAHLGQLEAIAAAFAVTIGQAGQIGSVFALVHALAAPLVALRLGGLCRRRLVTAGLLGLTLCDALAALAPSFALLLAAKAAAGVFACLIGPVVMATAIDLAAPGRGASVVARILLGHLTANSIHL